MVIIFEIIGLTTIGILAIVTIEMYKKNKNLKEILENQNQCIKTQDRVIENLNEQIGCFEFEHDNS